MHPNPDIDVNPEPVLRLFTEPGHLPGDLQPGLHRPPSIILMGSGVTEHCQQPITLGRADMALIAIHNAQHQVAITAHQHPIRLGPDPGRQHRRID